jgi:hypothetical protein
VQIALADAAFEELAQVLGSGCIEMDNVRVVYDSLPGRAICSGTIVDGLVWLVIDLDKVPSAHRHALAMVREVSPEVCVDLLERGGLTRHRRAPLALVG